MFTHEAISRADEPKPPRRSILSPRSAPVAPLRGARRFATITAAAGAAAAVIGLTAGPAAAGTITAGAPGMLGGPVVTTWASGYAAVPTPTSVTSFTHIQDTYVLPALNCAKTPGVIATAEFRTGMDGIVGGSSSIERVGVSATCAPGKPVSYAAWYQMVPANPNPINVFAPKAGDKMQPSVTFLGGGVYQLSMRDLTSGQHFTFNEVCTTCLHNSAQVTAGSPGPPGPSPRPADFTSVHFAAISVTDNTGTTGGLDKSGHWGTDPLIQSGSPYTLAGPLVSPYTAFTDIWK